MFTCTIPIRFGRASLAKARTFSSKIPSYRAPPPAIEGKQQSPAPSLFFIGLPTQSVFRAPGERRIIWGNLKENAKVLYEIASSHAPVVQLRAMQQGKNIAWIDFVRTADAISFKNKYEGEEPLVIRGNAVRIEFADRHPATGASHVGLSELALRYSVLSIPSNEAVQLVKRRFPGSQVTTNVKTSRGFLGTCFIQFGSPEDASEAHEDYKKNPLAFGDTLAEMSMHPKPSSELHLYNLQPFANYSEITEPLKNFGDIVNATFSFDRGGPRVSGRAHIKFASEDSAKKLFDATMSEDVVICGLPLRAENLWYSARERIPRVSTNGSDDQYVHSSS